jgi:hypothetical protein
MMGCIRLSLALGEKVNREGNVASLICLWPDIKDPIAEM